jgi:nicotinate-nucleotide pyrophosphorylase (carboxylating)
MIRARDIRQSVALALKEDRAADDITTRLLAGPGRISQAAIVAKESGILCGIPLAREVFRKLDPKIKFRAFYKDGQKVEKEARIALIKGKTRALLSGERTALNFLSHLSGIATTTHMFVRETRPYKTGIFDTRKTVPGMRALEKYAVRCAGGKNHRGDLNEMVLIKDNHRLLQRNGSLAGLLSRVNASTKKKVEIEVDSLDELKEALCGNADIILLDNMDLAQIKRAVRLRDQLRKNKRPQLEVSGGVNLKNVGRIAATGVDRISVGALTHTIKAVDMSLELIA